MKSKIYGALALFLLAGCTTSKPGAFERVDEDPVSHTVQYRYHPQNVDKTAMERDVAHYCSAQGFDLVAPLPPQESYIPGLKTTWYQCNYAIKG
ncbi:hypothetical protein [Mixta intestinalis]|jgi:hypothetical protein|uniref:Lipoprotein n=1 Tax=Mixta intestinalis TaxID=1615494 RepID=A0A6P1Q101_9GAMM|nr:hypothetical protein [Mixta intestinalis]QHM71934.1 hypothetical protein C7M51_02227 [Mixta intestinalis]